jgi:hypothetical protein
MGTWGTAIFSDDTAADVRERFRDLIGDGLSAEDATGNLLAEYSSSLDDPGDGPPFWLGLAVTQWKCGRLQAEVKERALKVIDSGVDLERWSGNTRLANARRAVLAKTRELLLSAQPPARRLTKPFRQSNEWDVGELVSYRTTSGKYVVLRVLGHHVDKGGKAPEIDLLDYYADTPPDAEMALTIAPRPLVEKDDHGYNLTRRCMVCATSAREVPADRLQRLGVHAPMSENSTRHNTRVLLWRSGRAVSLDTFIEQVMPGPVIWRPGPGGDDHLRWETGDLLACKMDGGAHLLLQLIDRHHGNGIDDAPVVAVLDWFPESLTEPAQISARPLTPFRTMGANVGFVLVNDGTDAVPPSTLTRLGRQPSVVDRAAHLFASLPQAARRVEQWFTRARA